MEIWLEPQATFGQARTCYSTREDILRVVLEGADAWKKLKKPNAALI
jgi:hypothetical protein